jgi:hypothetical protein
MSRAIFVRAIQCNAQRQDTLRATHSTAVDSGSSTGVVAPASTSGAPLRGRAVPHRPTPGTVFFAGYGSTDGTAQSAVRQSST